MIKFLLYSLCGGIGVITDYSVYYYLTSLDLWYQLANIIGYSLGTLVSFMLNRKMTFSVSDNTFQRLLLFFAIAMIGFVISSLLLYLFIEYLSLDSSIAKIMTLPFILVIQFSLNRKITFSNRAIS